MPLSTARTPVVALAVCLAALVWALPLAPRLSAPALGGEADWDAAGPIVPIAASGLGDGVVLADGPPAGGDSPPVGSTATEMQQLASGMGQLQRGVEQLGQNLKVTTVDKNWVLAIFGSLNGEMLFAESRPFIPSGVVLLFPDLGRDTSTFEAHAKSTNLGAVLAGPEILGMRSSGTFLTYLYGEQFEDDRYGLEFFFGNIIWDAARNLELGFAVSRWETSYADIAPVDIDAQSWIYQCRVRLKF